MDKFKILCIGLMIVISGFGGLFLISGQAQGFTLVPTGNISGTWDTAGSPYYIETGDITIILGEKLEIIPDSGPIDVIFNGSFNLWVQGDLFVNGTDTNKVTFTSNQGVPLPGDWITMNAQGPSGNIQMEHAIVEYAVTGIGLETDGNRIQDTEITSCSNNGLVINSGNNNNIQSTYIHDIANNGIQLFSPSENNTIENCNVSDTTTRGIYVQIGNHNTTVINTTLFGAGITGIQIEESNDS